jgi:enoyl-CoA hydratase
MAPVTVMADGPVVVITLDRPEVRNAMDPATARRLVEAFEAFDADPSLSVAVLTGAGGSFCAGLDLKAFAAGGVPPLVEHGPSPMGPVRMELGKPVIAAIEGPAVAGGLELALWCDLRVAASDAVLGVFNRRFGVPLVDMGTVRLPRIVGHGRAMDLILTGRPVPADEALAMGLVNRVVPPGLALTEARGIAQALARFPQSGLRGDRRSTIEQWSLGLEAAWRNELRHGLATVASGEPGTGARRFAGGEGRHGGELP